MGHETQDTPLSSSILEPMYMPEAVLNWALENDIDLAALYARDHYLQMGGTPFGCLTVFSEMLRLLIGKPAQLSEMSDALRDELCETWRFLENIANPTLNVSMIYVEEMGPLYDVLPRKLAELEKNEGTFS